MKKSTKTAIKVLAERVIFYIFMILVFYTCVVEINRANIKSNTSYFEFILFAFISVLGFAIATHSCLFRPWEIVKRKEYKKALVKESIEQEYKEMKTANRQERLRKAREENERTEPSYFDEYIKSHGLEIHEGDK